MFFAFHDCLTLQKPEHAVVTRSIINSAHNPPMNVVHLTSAAMLLQKDNEESS